MRCANCGTDNWNWVARCTICGKELARAADARQDRALELANGAVARAGEAMELLAGFAQDEGRAKAVFTNRAREFFSTPASQHSPEPPPEPQSVRQWLSDLWEPFDVSRMLDPKPQYRVVHCDISGCSQPASAEVNLAAQTGLRELSSKYLCEWHAGGLELVLATSDALATVPANHPAVRALKSAESDLLEAARLDPSLAGVEESLAGIRAALIRVGVRPQRVAKAAAAAREPPAESRRRVRRKKRRPKR